MIYRRIFSPVLSLVSAAPSGCRYFPSCSHFTEEAITRFGIFRGALMGFQRILRCHPWSTRDPWDPVPNMKSDLQKVEAVCCS